MPPEAASWWHDMAYLRGRFNTAFAQRSARDMEQQLNAAGVPAARVRKLGEFLDEVQDGSKLPLPIPALRSRRTHGAYARHWIQIPGRRFAAQEVLDLSGSIRRCCFGR